jgi:protein-L-isoaspartate(D-aspartate) O-methyltransferase
MSVERLLAELRRHVSDPRVLEALRAVPRDRFVPEALREEAWDNVPLPIGAGQTISQPLVVARMCELLELDPRDRVLDIGTGSGWHAAVLARLAARVWSVEVHPVLSRAAAAALAACGIDNVELRIGDGSRGLPEAAPFDAINVAAAVSGDELPPALLKQLAPGGRLVAPMGGTDQRLVLARREGAGVRVQELERVRFVPLVSSGGGR